MLLQLSNHLTWGTWGAYKNKQKKEEMMSLTWQENKKQFQTELILDQNSKRGGKPLKYQN